MHSQGNKTTLLKEYISDKAIYILALTETWLKSGDDVTVNQLTPDKVYALFELSHTARGGGVGFVFADKLPHLEHSRSLII